MSIVCGLFKFCRLLSELHRFHGQDVYADLGPAIARKKPYFRFIFALIRSTSRSRLVNFFLLCGVLLGYRVFRYPLPGCRIFQYGVSQNNITSFERLNRCLAAQGINDISMNSRPASFAVRLKAVFSLRAMWLAAGVLSRNRHNRPLVQVQTVIGCATLLLYSRNPLPSEVEVVCVASDHSPICQALLFLARREGRRTCYIQHAPISDHFPPLTHDLSILYDRASFLAYERAAVRHRVTFTSSVVLLSPFEEEFCLPKLEKKPYDIGVCLSFLPSLDAVSKLLVELSKSSSVRRVFLRPHPRCHLDISSLFEIEKVERYIKGQVAAEFFNMVDIVLVPNSGVAIEALHSGRPTFFTPGVDGLPDDYYGFVADGVVPVFRTGDLDYPERLMAFFNDAWVGRFSNHDETVNQTQQEAHARVCQSFSSLLSSGHGM